MNVLVLGSTGMAGHLIADYLFESGCEITTMNRRSTFMHRNIVVNFEDLEFFRKFDYSAFDYVINCIGILNKNCDLNKSEAVFINSFFPHIIEECLKNTKTRLIHLSTDCVFSGKKGGYLESDSTDGQSFYDRTKSLGEVINSKDLTFRQSLIGPDISESGSGLFNWFMNSNGEIDGYSCVFWTGVTTLTLAKAILSAMKTNLTGVYHLVNNQKISKHDLLCLMNKHFKNNQTIIRKSISVISDKSLLNSRKDFDFVVPSYEQMIIEMKEWVSNRPDRYKHYLISEKGKI